ncbi:MAG: hypothetical protein CVU44_11830 [Chloroflexi bacterium HGW-Chloroflexi-6]|nr:MAG: hypothetical protein CVU44_11830 [Chloroflexi bacterium HGW-Chloroflexi-6]
MYGKCLDSIFAELHRDLKSAQHRFLRTETPFYRPAILTGRTAQKRGGSPLLGGIHTTGFFGLLALCRHTPLLPVKPAVGRWKKK